MREAQGSNGILELKIRARTRASAGNRARQFISPQRLGVAKNEAPRYESAEKILERETGVEPATLSLGKSFRRLTDT
jgi:hypothetical protein